MDTVILKFRSGVSLVGFLIKRQIRQTTVKTVLPRIFMFLGLTSMVVWMFLNKNGHSTDSHTGYMAFGAFIGFMVSGAVSMVVIDLLKDHKQGPNS